MVLQKYLSQAGVCSRRQAEKYIKSGQITINGKKAKLGDRVAPGDKVVFRGRQIGLAQKKIYIKINKPVGVVCTNRKFEGEKNIFDLIGHNKDGLFIVGRLDKKSEGLVLLTNDGEAAYKLTHPKFEHEKEYLIKLGKKNYKRNEILEKFKKGVDIGEDDGMVKVKRIEYINKDTFRIVMTEGKKRQIRRMFKVFGLDIERLTRVRIKSLNLGGLKKSEIKFLTKKEIEKLVN